MQTNNLLKGISIQIIYVSLKEFIFKQSLSHFANRLVSVVD